MTDSPSARPEAAEADGGVAELAENGCFLWLINLRSCSQLGDKALATVSRYCKVYTGAFCHCPTPISFIIMEKPYSYNNLQ
jgi:hypothetical protein